MHIVMEIYINGNLYKFWELKPTSLPLATDLTKQLVEFLSVMKRCFDTLNEDIVCTVFK